MEVRSTSRWAGQPAVQAHRRRVGRMGESGRVRCTARPREPWVLVQNVGVPGFPEEAKSEDPGPRGLDGPHVLGGGRTFDPIPAAHYWTTPSRHGEQGFDSRLLVEVEPDGPTAILWAGVSLVTSWVTSKVLAQATDALPEKVRWSPTLAHDVRKYILVQGLWLASMVMVAMSDLFWQVSRLNLEQAPAFGHLGMTLGLLIGVGLGWPLVLLMGAVFLLRRRPVAAASG